MRELLEKLEKELHRLGHASPNYLQAGLSSDVVEAKIQQLGLSISDELLTLYSWHNGVRSDETANLGELCLFPGFYLMSLEEALTSYRNLGRLEPVWQATYLPIFSSGGGDYYALDTASGQVVGYYLHEEGLQAEYQTLTSLLETLVAAYENGIIRRAVQGYLDMDYGAFVEIAGAHNPALPIWQEMMEE